MKIYRYPQKNEWQEIVRRPMLDYSGLSQTVGQVLEQIRTRKDQALFAYEKQFDKVELKSLQVSEQEIKSAVASLDKDLKNAIDTSAANIRSFHASQQLQEHRVETTPGVTCWQRAVGIDRVGLYIPGGTAPLFSTVLMLAIPAKIAGCRQRILCTPPNREGKIHPAILYAAYKAEVSAIYKLGGIQAIGAMAYGTESVPKVYKIFGPGNQYVTMAKQLVSLHDVAIDMPAGPSEVMVVADKSANPRFVAADFLSQAEHGRDSQAILLTTDELLAEAFQTELNAQLELLPRKEITAESLKHSKVVVMRDDDEMMELVNEYAPEHLILQTANYAELAAKVRNAGSVFLGAFSPESAGDYASGTNHTLPTNGYAKAYNGVNLDSFVRKVTFQELSREGLRALGPCIQTMAAAEMLDAHKNAVTVRLNEMQ